MATPGGVRNLVTADKDVQVFLDTCDFYASATGILNKWKWPDIDGLENYKGRIVHSANWDPEITLDWMKGKNVALIGAGSTGIQLLPQVQPYAKTVDHYVSGKTWISPIGFGSEELKERGVTTGNCKIPCSSQPACL